MSTATESRFIRLLPPIALLLVVFAVYAHFYAHRTVGFDEAYTYIDYARSPIKALFLYSNPNNHLLHSFFMWITTSFIGNSLIGIRFTAFVSAILALAWTYRLGTRLHNRTAGLLAMALLATMAMFVGYAGNGRGYSLTVLLGLMLVELFFFSPLIPPRSRGRLIFLMTTLLVMTLPTMLLLIGALGLWRIGQAVYLRKGRGLLDMLVPAVFGSCLGTVFYSYGLINGGLGGFSDRFGYESFSRMLTDFVADLSPGVLMLVLVVGLLAGIILGWKRHARFLVMVGVIVGSAVILAVAQFALTRGGLFPRNYIYLLPFIALIAGIGGALLVQWMPRSGWVTALLIVLILPGGLWHFRSITDPLPADVISTAIDAHRQPDDALIIGCCVEYQIAYLKGYYLPQPQTDYTRTVIIPSRLDPLEELYDRFLADTAAICLPDTWNTVDVYICDAPPG